MGDVLDEIMVDMPLDDTEKVSVEPPKQPIGWWEESLSGGWGTAYKPKLGGTVVTSAEIVKASEDLRRLMDDALFGSGAITKSEAIKTIDTTDASGRTVRFISMSDSHDTIDALKRDREKREMEMAEELAKRGITAKSSLPWAIGGVLRGIAYDPVMHGMSSGRDTGSPMPDARTDAKTRHDRK